MRIIQSCSGIKPTLIYKQMKDDVLIDLVLRQIRADLFSLRPLQANQ